MQKEKIIALAPMDGITNCAYRTVVKELFEKHNTDPHAKLWLRTEFMNVEWFVREPWRLIHHIIKTDFEDTTIAQIYGWDHDALFETALYIDKKHPEFAWVELNIGCPSPKIMACGGGAGMMRDREKTLQLIKKISSSIQLPFSIKTRVWLTQDDMQEQHDFIVEAANYCKTLTVHGRTYKQSHSGFVDWEYIYNIKKEVWDKCLIIGNGWIRSYEEMLAAQGNLDGVMVGQAAIGRPRILLGKEPTIEERYELIMRHMHMMIILFDFYERISHLWRDFTQPTYDWLQEQIRIFDATKYEPTKTLIEYRKYLFNYISGLPGNKELKQELAQVKDYASMASHITSFFDKVTKNLQD